MSKHKVEETIADIAYYVGNHGFYSGDSRADMSFIRKLAYEFEAKWQNADQGFLENGDDEHDYIFAIDEYCKSVVHPQFKQLCESEQRNSGISYATLKEVFLSADRLCDEIEEYDVPQVDADGQFSADTCQGELMNLTLKAWEECGS